MGCNLLVVLLGKSGERNQNLGLHGQLMTAKNKGVLWFLIEYTSTEERRGGKE